MNPLKLFGKNILPALAVICFLISIPSVWGKKLETVTDTDFLKLVQTEKYVVVLFSKSNCKDCQEAEHELAMARESLVDEFSAWVVKLVSSPLAKLYLAKTVEPAIVFFRHGVPLLYHGPVNEDDLVSKFRKTQDPIVKELNDETFEHLTQAATGATTGDWLVMFYKNTCITSQRLQALWEAVGAELKGRINVARVDKSGAGAATGRRFEVKDTPAFVLFRHGKMYNYELDSLTVQNFVDFATDFFRNSKAQNIPVPKSPFDDFTEMVVEKMRENPQVVKLGSIVLSILILLGLLIKFSRKAQDRTEKKKT
jgi:thiol-disulfide isomerase/thioredoxin